MHRLDPALVNRIGCHLDGGTLRLLYGSVTLDEIRDAAEDALKRFPHAKHGRPSNTGSLALRQFALGLATVWRDHAGQVPARRHRYGEDYGPFHAFVDLILNGPGQCFKSARAGTKTQVDHLARVGIAEFQLASTCGDPNRARGDGWAENGAKGWAFADVLPVFKSQEDWEGGANEWRGSGGPIHIRRPKDPHPTAPTFIDAARQIGMPILHDVNGPMRPGAGYINMNIAVDGTRASAARAFLRPALSRPNLTLLLNNNVVKLNFKGTRGVGVKINTDGAVKDITAEKEVIVAAGAIGSPKLLMLSGLGEAKALRSLGIDVVENLPGVGENLQDHVLVSGVVFKYKGKMPDRPADSNAVEAEAYLSSRPSADTDIGLVLHQLPVVTPKVASRFGTPSPDTFTIAPALVQPTSIGSVRLASANFQDAALIDGNYLATDRDITAVMRAIEAARELGSQHAFDNLRESELIPGPTASVEEIQELARLASASFGHAVAGPGTNAPIHMIAGRAAKLVLGRDT